jgi:hypothetical protein
MGTTAAGGRKTDIIEISSMPPPRPRTAVREEEKNAALMRRALSI